MSPMALPPIATKKVFPPSHEAQAAIPQPEDRLVQTPRKSRGQTALEVGFTHGFHSYQCGLQACASAGYSLRRVAAAVVSPPLSLVAGVGMILLSPPAAIVGALLGGTFPQWYQATET